MHAAVAVRYSGLAAAGTTRIGSKTQRAVGTRRRRAPTPFAMRRCSRRLALVAALVATLLLVGSVAAGGADWDDDDAVYDSPQEAKMRDAAAKSAADASAERARARMEARQRAYRDAPPMFEWRYEGVGIAVVLAFVINFLAGDAINRRMARDFERAFLSDRAAGVFHREFAEVGAPGARGPSRGSILSREAPDEYTLYATGRRFVDAVTVTLRLKKRNDLYSAAYDLLRPGELDPDRVVVECAMREGVVQPGTVFAVGDKAAVATLERNAGKRDVARLCGSHAPGTPRSPRAPSASRSRRPRARGRHPHGDALAAALGSAFAGPAGRTSRRFCAEEASGKAWGTDGRARCCDSRVDIPARTPARRASRRRSEVCSSSCRISSTSSGACDSPPRRGRRRTRRENAARRRISNAI